MLANLRIFGLFTLLLVSPVSFAQLIPFLDLDTQQSTAPTAEDLSKQSGFDPKQMIEEDEVTEIEKIPPFGAKLFTGNFLKGRGDGVNPGYLIQPGDKVSVAAWGSLTLNEIFTVDTQGNIFIPGIGPMKLEGVRNSELTRVVKSNVGKVLSSCDITPPIAGLTSTPSLPVRSR